MVRIQAARIPPALAEPGAAAVVDLTIDHGRIASISPSSEPARCTVIPCPVDLHVHLDKTYAIDEVGASPGNLFHAISRMASHRDTWTEAHVRPRFERGLEDAYRHGTRAVRTHIDFVTPAEPAGWLVGRALAHEWADRLCLQMVALTPLDLFDPAPQGPESADVADHIAQAVASTPGALLGAFVYRNDRLHEKLHRVFALAKAHDLDIDFHVDEGLDLDATGLAAIAELTLAHGWQGRVTCGHCCSLSVQSPEWVAQTLAKAAEAGIHLVSLPTTNAYLQGSWQGTPVERGVTRLIEADAAGVATSIASDNVEDAFYPYGSYDLIANFAFGVQLAHLASPHGWLPAITTRPAAAMRLAWQGHIALGAPADLVVLAATTEHELLTPRGQARQVMRHGAWLPQTA